MKTCFECGLFAHHDHHVVPKVLGGIKKVPLCEYHHGLVHGIKFFNHSQLTLRGIKLAKLKGKKFGRPPIQDKIKNKIFSLSKKHKTQREISSQLNVSLGYVSGILKQIQIKPFYKECL